MGLHWNKLQVCPKDLAIGACLPVPLLTFWRVEHFCQLFSQGIRVTPSVLGWAKRPSITALARPPRPIMAPVYLHFQLCHVRTLLGLLHHPLLARPPGQRRSILQTLGLGPSGAPGLHLAFGALTPISIYPRGNLNYLLRGDPFQATDSVHEIKCNLASSRRALTLISFWSIMFLRELLWSRSSWLALLRQQIN
jgi:hypothetical protein